MDFNMDENKTDECVRLGWDSIKNKQNPQAIVFFSIALTNEPDNIEALFGLATVSFNLSQYEKALEELNLVEQVQFKIGQPYKKLYILRGDIYMVFHDYEKAINEYDKVLAIDPGMGEVYAMRGFAKKELGAIDSANYDFSRANELGHGLPSWMIK